MELPANFATELARSRVKLMTHPDSAFLFTVLMMMKLVYDDGIGTAGVDGVNYIISPKFFMQLPPNQRVTLHAHEAMHLALQHCVRGHAFADHDIYNRAADHVINLMLEKSGYEKIPGYWLADQRFAGMSTEEVYRILLAEKQAMPPMGGGGGSDGVGGHGQPLDRILKPGQYEKDDDPSNPVSARVRQQVAGILAAAATAAKMSGQAGSIPDDVKVYLDSLVNPKLPMAYYLRRFFHALAKTDYSYRRMNRRMPKMILPTLAGKAMGELDFAFDMSISVSNTDTRRYVSEIHGVMGKLKPEKINIIQFDTDIKSVTQVKSIRDLKEMELRGRGGTCIEALMRLTKQRKPKALVVFTDGEYVHPSFNPGVPILWMIHGSRKDKFHCDFGTTVLFDV